MGGPNPGIDANFVVEKVEDLGAEYDLVRLTIRVPKYCTVIPNPKAGEPGQPDQIPYFVEGQQYGAHVIADYPVPPEPKES